VPRPRLDDDQQNAILDAAVVVIAQRGAASTRLADVARAIGRSTGTLQHYFGSRDELLAAAFRRLNDAGAEAARAAAAEIDDPWARLQSVLDEVLGGGPDWTAEWQVWLEFWTACARDPQLRALTGDVYATWRSLIAEAIAEGRRSGAFTPVAPPAEVAAALLALLDGLALHALLGIAGDRRQATARRIVRRVAASYLGVGAAA
jgi:AcrR family transcriptional regulator